MQTCTFDAICRVSSLTELAFLTVVDRQKHEVANLEIFVLHILPNSFDSARTLVPEYSWVRAYLYFTLLED